LDIKDYPRIKDSSNTEDKLEYEYPDNTRKVENVFDFEKFCNKHSEEDLSELFLRNKPVIN